MIIVAACVISAAFGFMVAAIFDGQAYDHGFDDGYECRMNHERMEREDGEC